MYSWKMQNHMQNLNHYMLHFDASLKHVQTGSSSLNAVKGDIERSLNNIKKVRRSIESESPRFYPGKIRETVKGSPVL